MASRGRLTTEAVLQELGLEDDYDADEPMMPRSDEFSDLEDGYLEDVEDDDSDTPPPPSDAPTPSSDTLPCWSAALNPVTIPPFTSPVGPKVSIPESPSDTFQLMFTPALLDSMVEQSNMYAKEVMGEEKFSSWE